MSFEKRSPFVTYAVLILLSAALIAGLQAIRLPGGAMVGAMMAAIILAFNGAKLRMPRWVFTAVIGLIGAMIAQIIDRPMLMSLADDWAVLLAGASAVVVLALGQGALLARFRLLPGTAAVWGSAPGAASIMLLLAIEAGANAQIVAVMQFLRLILVAWVAALVALLFATPVPIEAAAAAGQHGFAWFPFVATTAVAVASALVGERIRLPGGSFMMPLVICALLANGGVLTITLSQPLMTVAFALAGWSIGFGFTRETVIYAGRKLPLIIASICTLMLLCGGLGYALHLFWGVDPLSAYLATSPAGMDSIAIIAASAEGVDMRLVTGMQVTRFLLVLFVGPYLVRAVAAWMERRVGGEPVRGS